jgi:hypothetical protein
MQPIVNQVDVPELRPPSQARLNMVASMNIVAHTDGKKTEVNQLNLENLRTELNRVKADLKDELDKVNADAERLRAFNGSHLCVPKT